MKPLRFTFAFLFSILNITFLVAGSVADSVTISGKVTGFDTVPVDSCSVIWHNAKFETVAEALTDANGNYSIRIPKGKYPSMAAIRMNTYPNSPALNVPPAQQQLEFWGWNFIADRDTVCDLRYHRMEAYGLHAFRIPGAAPVYQIYVRPLSLTRVTDWMNGGMPPVASWSPSQNALQTVVSIDGEEVPVLMTQEIKEYFSPESQSNAYLLTVGMPKKKAQLPYRVFKVELTDLENGDRGEGIYFMEL